MHDHRTVCFFLSKSRSTAVWLWYGRSIPLLEMTWNIRSFSVNRSIEFETLHGSLVVYCCDFQRARSNLDVFDNLWCARSVQQEFSHAWTVPCISAPCSCCTESQCLLSGHFCCCMHFVWYYSVLLVLGKFMMSKLWILNWDLILNFLHAFCMVL